MIEQNTVTKQLEPFGKAKRLNKFSKFPLYANETPTIREKPGQGWIPFGKNNDYMDYLAYLYNNSGIHNAIVQGKSYYIYGQGWKVKKGWTGNTALLDKFMQSVNPYQTLDELSKKIIFEHCLYGGRAYLIEWGVNGQIVEVKHQPFNTIRTNKSRTEFYISGEWTREMSVSAKWKKGDREPADMKILKAFNKTERVGSQILYLCDENPGSDIYPLPEYQAGNTSIETDVECGFFHLNNVKSGFAAGTMITFFIGTDENDEAQDEIEKELKRKTAGTDNAGEVLLNFQAPNTVKPEVSPLRSNELDKQYEQLAKDVTNKILYGHRVSSGLLFGIKMSQGIGGDGRAEFDLAWEHFCNTYVIPKQKEQADDINYILSLIGITGDPLELQVLEPIGLSLDMDTIKSVLSKDEVRAIVINRLGIEETQETKINDILTTLSSASPLVANKILDSLTPNEMRNIVGLSPIAGGEVIPTAKVEAFNKFKDDVILKELIKLGVPASDYTIVFEVGRYDEPDEFAAKVSDEDVIAILQDNKKISVKALAEQLGVSQNQVYKILDRLTSSNQVAVKYIEKGDNVIIKTENVTKDVELETKWRYAGPNDEKTRPFCKKLIKSQRLYTRAEIDNLSNDMKDFTDDVWKYKGGWYHDPARSVNVPQCRHHWQQIVVRKIR